MKIEKNNLALLGIMLSVLSLSVIVINPLKEAYALQYSIITTTGTQTNDNCISTVDNNNQVWLLCNPTTGGSNAVLSLTDSRGNQLATLSTTLTFATVNQMLAITGNSQIVVFGGTTFVKYQYSGVPNVAGGTIQQIGILTLSSCTNTNNAGVGYDNKGFIWYSCPTQQTVGAMNPTSMTDSFRSIALTLGNGFPATCLSTSVGDSKAYWFNQAGGAFGTANGLVAVQCTNPQTVELFDLSFSGGTITQGTHKNSLTNLGGGSSSAFPQLYFDGDSKRIIFMNTANGIDTWTYTISGVTNFFNSMTSEKTAFGSTGQYNCVSDFQFTNLNNGHILYCAGTNLVEGFMSNSTLFASTFNIGSYSTTYSASKKVGGTYDAGTFVFSTGVLDAGTQTFLYITGTATTYTPPIPTSPPASNSTGGSNNTCKSTSTTPHCYGDVNCDTGNNANILGCQIALNNSPALKSASQSTTSSVNFLLTQTGLVNSTNTNIKTNGTGYILTGVVMGIMVAVFYLASGGDLKSMPTFIWFLGTLGVLGLAVAFGWLDTTFFIIAILAVIALASTRVIQQLELGGFK